MKTAQDVMSRNVMTLSPAMTLADAARALGTRDVGGAPVCDPASGRPLGVVSKTDLLEACFDARARVPALTVRDVMSTDVVSVRPETPLPEVVEVLVFEALHRVFVVDAAGELVGVITPVDALRELSSFLPRRPGGGDESAARGGR